MLTYENCTLCPRSCGVNRKLGQKGFCKMPGSLLGARAMLHYGEEPPISGCFGTGAIFFSGCTLNCVYCQNRDISKAGKGMPLTTQRLREILEELVEQGAQSIDLVTPTHFLPDILPALSPKLPVPVVYNCGGYESVETLRELEGLIDVYLPDFKYSDNQLAKRLSHAPDYFETAAAAIQEMYRQTGGIQMEGDLLKRGVLVRHLVLPGYLSNTLGVIDWVSQTFPKKDVLFSLMSQYVPMGEVAPPLDRKLTAEEYDGAVSWMELCGLDQGYVQDFSAATTEYLPQFNFEGL